MIYFISYITIGLGWSYLLDKLSDEIIKDDPFRMLDITFRIFLWPLGVSLCLLTIIIQLFFTRD